MALTPGKYEIKVDIDAATVNWEEWAAKFKSLAESAKKANKAMVVSFKNTNPESPTKKLAENLARCAAKLWGPEVTMDWHQDNAAMINTLGIRVRKPGPSNPLNDKVQWVFQFTQEFLWELEKGTDMDVAQNAFVSILPEMCHFFDKYFKFVYALPLKSPPLWADSTLSLFDDNVTTSSYEYLKAIGFIDRVIAYWHSDIDTAGPILKSWFKETEFDKGEFLSFATGGFIKKNLYHSNELSNSGSLMHEICPGLKEEVNLPCGCKKSKASPFPERLSVANAIIHLNDYTEHNGVEKEWTREEIADWLESLDVDLTLRDNGSKSEKENTND